MRLLPRRMWIAGAAIGVAAALGHSSLGGSQPPPALLLAYGENIGWLNLHPSTGSGMVVSDTAVTGFGYGENIGWVNFHPTFGGVVNDGTGRLSGYAWGENIGWINFSPAHGGVTIDACGDFNGYAWGENVGWISFRSDGAVPFRVRTPWVSPIDGVPPETSATTSPPLATWNAVDVTVSLSATDCGTGVAAIHYRVDGGTEIVAAASSVSFSIASNGIHSISYFAVDTAGNHEAPAFLTVRVDKTPPTVVVNVPANGGHYLINQQVLVDFDVSDTPSGVATVVSTLANGAPLDTSTVGPHTVMVTAIDRAGNTRQVTSTYTVVFPGNIDPANSGAHVAYGENIGWINLRPGRGPGLTVTDTAISGFAWSENVGWINFNPANGSGVTNDGAGNLAGYAWSENAGWISLSCTNTTSCGRVNYGVRIDGSGKFTGHAWGENIGWIRFAPEGAVPFGTTTSWRPPDITPPTIVCPSNIVQSTDPGVATRVVSYPAPVATDNGPSVTVTSVPSSGFAFPLGTTTVHATATDAAGNTAACSFTVTVRDTEPPVVSCPANIVRSNDPGQAGAIVSFTPTATDNVPGVIVFSTPVSGSFFALGPTGVNATARDAAGNLAACGFVVRVNDTEPPAITAPANVVVEATGATGAVVPDATLGTAAATDNAPGVTVTRTGVPAGNLFPLGTTPVSYVATDSSGLSAVAAQQVTVRDTTPPAITIVAPGPGPYAPGQSVVASYSCADTVSSATCSGPVPSGIPVDTAVGTHSFTVTSTDAAGNSGSRSVSYSVSYGVCLLYDPALAKKAGSTIPIKLQLCDAAGHNLSSASIALTALDVLKISNQASSEVEDAGHANPDSNFRFDATLGGSGGYIFNLQTTGFSTGTYVLRFSVAGDQAVHASEARFQVR